MRTDRTTQLQRCIDRLRAGDTKAREELIVGACGRLRVLAHHMLRGDRVRRWEQTDDVLQQSLVTLHRTLANIQPATVRDFLGLAALHIRRTLAQLARHYFRPNGHGANHASNGVGDTEHGQAFDTPSAEGTPDERLEEAERWNRLHAEIERLADDEREVIELLWFHDLTQVEAAEIAGVSERTVQRRWVQARLKLHAALKREIVGD
jgi:RNA polymerase sigma-70 factor (ECF subfamily)